MFQVTGSTPSVNSIEVPVGISELVFTFAEDLSPASITDMSVTLTVANSSTFQMVPGRVDMPDTNAIRFVPASALKYSTEYRAIVTGGTWGVKAISGRTLDRDYYLEFTTEALVENDNDGGGDPDPDVPIGGIPLDNVTTRSPLSVIVENGKVRLVYEDELPAGTTAQVTSRHILGYNQLKDHWLLNLDTPVVGGSDNNELHLGSSGVYNSSTANLWKVYSDGQLLFFDSIPLISREVQEDGENHNLVFDFSVNREYTVYVLIPDEGTYKYTFTGHVGPMLATVEEAKFSLGGLLSAFQSDEEIRIHLMMSSQKAYQIWLSGGCHKLDKSIPYYLRQYVITDLALSAYRVYQNRIISSGQTESVSLGDFKVSMSDPSSSVSGDLQFDPEEFDKMLYILATRIKSCSLSDEPIWGPAYSLMAPNPREGIIGLVPGRGRADSTYGILNRSLGHGNRGGVPGHRRYNPEMD